MDDCIFCGLLAGRLPISKVHEDAMCTAFMDIQPVNPGHLLVIPNDHAAYLADLAEATGAHLFRIAQRLAATLRRSNVQCEGINLFLADGAAAMQEVFHVHLHVIPRYVGDGFGLRFSEAYWNKPERIELDQIAANLRGLLEAS